MDDKKVVKNKLHHILMENRQKLSISGVLEVESFNDEFIVLETEMGMLVIRGQNIKINRLNLESAEMLVEGNICACEYTDDEGSKGKSSGFWAKLFK